jgi:hypothetical protein
MFCNIYSRYSISMDTHMLVYSESEFHRWRYLRHLIGPYIVTLSRFHLFFRRSVADITQFSPWGTPGSTLHA